MVGLLRKIARGPPSILSQHKAADARLAVKLAGIFQPMVEPAQKDRVGIEQRLGTEIGGADTISPGDVLPRSGNQVLMLACKRASGVVAQRQKGVDAPVEKNVVPAADMEGRHLNAVKPLADVERCPIFARLIVIEPIEHVPGYALPLQSGMLAKRQHAGLHREIVPSFLESGTRGAQLPWSRVRSQHLRAPAKGC